MTLTKTTLVMTPRHSASPHPMRRSMSLDMSLPDPATAIGEQRSAIVGPTADRRQPGAPPLLPFLAPLAQPRLPLVREPLVHVLGGLAEGVHVRLDDDHA